LVSTDEKILGRILAIFLGPNTIEEV